MGAIWAIGDVHGHRQKLLAVLQANDLIDESGHWQGGDQTLWFLGDYFDRGPDGLGVVALIMALQSEAERAGGQVGALIGNHDVLILAARRFGTADNGTLGGRFVDNWRVNGGQDSDLSGLTPETIGWLAGLPALALTGGRLLAHADSTFYRVYGDDVTSINLAIQTILAGDDIKAWDRLLGYFAQRRAFTDRFRGRHRAQQYLRALGGGQLVHAHTPIARLTGRDPKSVVAPYEYAGGLCLDTDPGLYMGGPGFAVNLQELV